MKLGLFNKIRGFFGTTSGREGGVFYGWYIVLTHFVASLWEAGTFFYGFGAFFKPLAQEFGWSRAATSSLWSFGRFEGAVEGPFGGIATDRWGARKIHLIGVFLSGLGFCLMYFTRDYVTAFTFWIITSIGFNLGYPGPLDKALTDWFIRRRGTALSLTRIGRAIGGSVMPSFMTIILLLYGWREAFLVVGVMTWIINLPLAWFFVRPYRPEYYGLMPDGEMVEEGVEGVESMLRAGEEYSKDLGEYEFTWRQALRTRAFWIPQLAAIFSSLYYAITVHIIPYLTDMGVEPVVAAASMGFMVLMSTPGRIIGGVVVDRLSTGKVRYPLVFSSLFYALGMLTLLNLPISGSNLYIYISLAFFGVGIGISATARTLMMARYFGRKNFGTITGIQATIGLPSTLIVPIYAGWVYDTTGSYLGGFILLLALDIVGIFLYLISNPPKQPSE
jgi:sugar phosphate permease